MLEFYRRLTASAAPVFNLYLQWRTLHGKEDRARLPERRGIEQTTRPDGLLLWLHAASVGEAMSALPLIREITARRPDITILQTTGTVTSARIMANRLPNNALHRFAPLDHPRWVARFLNHWRPDAAVWLESELWPNLVLQTHKRGVPMLLANARLSTRSRRRWEAFSEQLANLLRCFDKVLVQDAGDVAAYRKAGAAQVSSPGNLKRAAPPLPADETALRQLQTAIGDRPFWIAASTHWGEEEIALKVHRRLAAQFPALLTIIAPRHPERGGDIAALVKKHRLRGVRRALKGAPPPGDDTEVYIADTLGELGVFYRLNGPVFVGGSLTLRDGGHNPVEPAQLGRAIIHGPDMSNFAAFSHEMRRDHAALTVMNTEELYATLHRLLRHPQEAAILGARAARYAAEGGEEILHRITDAILTLLPER